MKAASIPAPVVRHAGFVMAHAAVVVSELKADELICPFAVITKGESRQSLEFEAESQDKAVSEAWASLDAHKERIDLWAMAREGLVSTSRCKADVLVVASWGHDMGEAVMFTQRFHGRGRTFELAGPIEVQAEASAEELSTLRSWFHQGINQHPRSALWWVWADAAQQGAPADHQPATRAGGC
jgi:hypothetical protein